MSHESMNKMAKFEKCMDNHITNLPPFLVVVQWWWRKRRFLSHRPLWDASRTWRSTASRSHSTGFLACSVRSTWKSVRAEGERVSLHHRLKRKTKKSSGPRPLPTMCNLLPRQRMCLCVRMYIEVRVSMHVYERLRVKRCRCTQQRTGPYSNIRCPSWTFLYLCCDHIKCHGTGSLTQRRTHWCDASLHSCKIKCYWTCLWLIGAAAWSKPAL